MGHSKSNTKSNKTRTKSVSNIASEPLSDLTVALKHFEIAEANLVKLERLWKEMQDFIPEGIAFGSNPDYEEKSYSYKAILPHLPKIDGWRPSAEPMELNDIAQSRFDANEIQEVSALVSVDDDVYA